MTERIIALWRAGTAPARDGLYRADGTAVAVDTDGMIVCGDGELGADGFFARLGSEGTLRWVVASVRANPFERIAVSGTVVEVTNNPGNSISFDLLDPNFS